MLTKFGFDTAENEPCKVSAVSQAGEGTAPLHGGKGRLCGLLLRGGERRGGRGLGREGRLGRGRREALPVPAASAGPERRRGRNWALKMGILDAVVV